MPPVFGRTLDEALNPARDSIKFRLRETGLPPDPVITFARDSPTLMVRPRGLTVAGHEA